jgi:ABC-type polysaccharide/polyol phosphate transport system ATPase subunit
MNMLTESKLASMPEAAETDPVVELEDVSVLYRVPRERVSGIKEYTIRWLQRKLQYVEFWALHGVTFQVKRGEVFGVIGRNGSGKSTMLKVMARVLKPTQGRIVTRGKVAPLLELGAGFHPELSGRENIFLNGALLGFTRKEAQDLQEEIIDFSGVREFIDAPLRTFSTGMIARLGFAVATSKRPEILLVDEVLSVGDGPFQEKCLERMNLYRTQGTTIIIVTHAMETIQSFCQRALWLDHGKIQAQGVAGEVVEQYINSQ